MVKYLFTSVACCAFCLTGYTQNVGIGGTAPDASAALHISSASQGVLIPRMLPASINSISGPAKGLIVYDSVNNQLKINTGNSALSNWQALAFTGGWGLHGNAGTNPSINFIGTTDTRPLRFGVYNIAAGFIDSVSNNSFYGFRSGSNNAGSIGNAGFGYKALNNIVTGNYNTAVGDSVLYNSSGYNALYNTAIGSGALPGNKSYATAMGFQSQNEVQLYATTFGAYALGYNIAAGTAIGHSAMGSPYNFTGHLPVSINLAIGSQALGQSYGGSHIAFGYSALFSDDASDHLIGFGSGALYKSYKQPECVAVGTNALWQNAGQFNTGTGSGALYQTINNSATTGIGYQAGYSGGDYNTAAGANSQDLRNSILSANNSSIGREALLNNSIGINNTAAGAETLYNNTSGNNNVALGLSALYTNSVSSGNTAAGVNAQFYGTLGANTAVGGNALMNTTASLYNTAVGYNSGSRFDMGYNNTMVGANCDIAGPQIYNCVAIGQDVTCTDVSQVRIGNLATGSIGGYAGWTVISDGRVKKEIEEKVPGLAFILQLRPVTYQLDLNTLDNHLHRETKKITDETGARALARKEQKRYSGFIAQEVELAAGKLNYRFSGLEKPRDDNSTYGLRYDEFISPLTKAIQEQQQMIQTLKKQNADLEQVNKDQDALYNQILAKIILLETSKK